MVPQAWSSDAIKISSKADLQAEKGSCHAWMVQVGVLFVQEAQAGGCDLKCDLWSFGPHTG